MATSDDVRQITASLQGTTVVPHFDRTAFKVRHIYATLAADEQSANLKLAPDEQELKCMMNAAAFTPVANAWGRRGWTTVRLDAVSYAELRDTLEMAWRHSVSNKRGIRRAT